MSTSNDQSDPRSFPKTNGRSRPRIARWGVPAGVLVAAGATAAATGLIPLAGAAPSLAPKTAARLLAGVANARPRPFSGTVVQTSRLGLPQLPDTGKTLSPTALLSGSHTLRLWYRGPTHLRAALVGDLAETDLIRNGRAVWLWNSEANAADRFVVPRHTGRPATPLASPGDPSSLTPQRAAAELIAKIDPSTEVRVQGTSSVAGRSAYELVLRPRAAASLVDEVRLAVDSKTSMPLRVQVFAKGHSDAAFETGFTALTLGRPDASVLAFRPPPGAKVSRGTPGALGIIGGPHPMRAPGRGPKADLVRGTKAAQPSGRKGSFPPPGALRGHRVRRGPSDEPIVHGRAWTSVVELRGVDLGQLAAGGDGRPHRQIGGPDLLSTLSRAMTPVHGSFGSGRVLSTRLLSVLALDNGRVFAGAVTVKALERAATQ